MTAPTASRVLVEAGRIIVQPSMADFFTCRRIGGVWDSRLRAWAFPETREAAAMLAGRLRRVAGTEQFEALLAPPSGTRDEQGEAVPTGPATVPAQMAVDQDEATATAVAEHPAGTAEQQPAPVAPAAPPDEPQIVVPAGLITAPWRHQKAAYKFCMDKLAAGYHGLLLAMGMGCGKSLVACMLVLGLAARRVLIACPLRVIPVWLTQFERHVGIEYVIVVLDEAVGSVAKKRDLAEAKIRLAHARGVPFIAVINYDSAWREPFASWAERVSWDLAIADEIHRIKAAGGKTSLAFKRLRMRANTRVGLTGTPMPHGPMDIFGPFRFLDIRLYGPSFSAFRQKYAVMGGYQRKQITGFQRLDELEAIMSKITFRVGKDVLDLPPETHVTYYCELSAEGARIYREVDEDFVARVLDGTITATNALVKLLRLQQVANGIVKTDDGVEHRVDDSKRRLLADTLEDIGKDEPVVVFCRFHLDMDAVHEACEAAGFTSLELSGRRDQLKRWQDGEAQVLAVQISAGGIGVDLTRARFSIYYSLSFSLGEYDQSLARIHRPGQTRPVEHIHLLTRGTVDVKIMRALEKRAEIVESILAEIRN